ncbi:AMP-binding protein [Halobacteriovorax sp. JY17]|uniref:AMP-binding protein n=1 Tax=Halobacteriovorax sp. JY17 TaxID=2014617 RepID=UPI000C4BCD6A|nr:AMP-binding protein [Halobacteriovorax sp. JY17]PIK14890.1 MAG: AMP-ligase [Halobacteriovorax sp. JY17]
MKSYVVYHGSPGTAEDFEFLKEKLGDVTVLKRGEKKDSDIYIGYSFGSYFALRDFANNPKAKKLILVAPYLYSEALGFGKKLLIGNSFLANLIIPKMSEKIIESLLVKSSSPKSVPDEFRSIASKYRNVEVLREAALEKDITSRQLKELADKVKGREIHIIWGDSDESLTSDHRSKIKSLLKANEIVLEKTGHAIPWTDREELVKNLECFSKDSTEQKTGYYDGEDSRNNVATFLKEHVRENPDKSVLAWVDLSKIGSWSGNLNEPLPHETISVKDLDHLVSKISNGLIDLGIEKGDRVIIFIPMSLQLYAAMFALQKIGGIAVFLDSWARRDQMGVSAETADPKAIISLEKAFQYLSDVREIGNIPIKVSVGPTEGEYTSSLEKLMSFEANEEVTPVEKEHTALITFTTGSSGKPKGADRSHRFLSAQHYALNRHIPYVDSDVDLPVFPIFSLNNLAAGVTTVIPAIDVGAPSEKDPLVLIAQFLTMKVTCTTLSPSLLNAVSAFCLKNNLKLNGLKRVVTGGAPVSRDDVKRIKEAAPNAEILVLYGSTEVEPMAHIEAKDMLAQKGSSDPEIVEPGVNVGKFDTGLEVKYIKIKNENLSISKNEDWADLEVSKGSPGEIIVSGEHVCRNYFNNEEAFKKSKIVDDKGRVWHRTGDLGFEDEKGDLWLVGRVHNAINRGGEYCFPVRAEIIMKKISLIKHAAYLGVEDSKLGEKPIAVFSVKDGASEAEAISEVSRMLKKNKITFDDVIVVDHIPMDPRHHSKVEYHVLRATLKEAGKI